MSLFIINEIFFDLTCIITMNRLVKHSIYNHILLSQNSRILLRDRSCKWKYILFLKFEKNLYIPYYISISIYSIVLSWAFSCNLYLNMSIIILNISNSSKSSNLVKYAAPTQHAKTRLHSQWVELTENLTFQRIIHYDVVSSI